VHRRLAILALAAAPILSGCERPFVAPDPNVLAETTPDLDLVQTEEVLSLRLRVSDPLDAERLTVNGTEAAPAGEPGVFLDTLRLDFGVNPVFVAVFDRDGNVTEDTLYAVFVPFVTAFTTPLPEPRYEHTATPLADGRVLVAGGFGGGPDARGDALLVEEQAGGLAFTPLPALRRARAGHTATRLPDGRVLLLGGVVRDLTNEPAAFVAEAEVFDPATGTFTAVAQEGEPLRRYEHAALALGDDGRMFVYAYGGLEPGVDALRATGTLVVMELRPEGGTTVLATLSPAGGVGTLPPTFAHALLALPPEDDAFRALAVGTDVTGAGRASRAQRLTFRPSTTFFPFEVAAADVAPPDTALGQFGAAPVEPGLLLLSGGGLLPPSSTAAPASDALRLYADAAGRFFPFPAAVGLRAPRARHSATLLPSGRILLLGGVGKDATDALAQAELIGPE
jgi:hypothetical protein